MDLSMLSKEDWADFRTLHPGAHSFLQGRALAGELAYLRRLGTRSPWQQWRLAELEQWAIKTKQEGR